jgi:hypothetical protein
MCFSSTVGWTRIVNRDTDLLAPGFVFQPKETQEDIVPMAYYAVGMAFDRGLGSPQWGRYQDCYGKRCVLF